MTCHECCKTLCPSCRSHSRLSGSRDLERWAGQAATGLRSTYRENVLGPLAQLRDELFKTFRWGGLTGSD